MRKNMMGKTNFLRAIICSAFAGTILFYQSASGQTIDPSMLDSLKNQVGVRAGNQTVISPLDEARQKERQKQQENLLEQRMDVLKEVSRLEEDYRDRLGSEIAQYGYSIFANIPAESQVMTGTISDTYKLGIGDELIITLQGSKSQSFTVTVDLEGRVIIPDLKPITVSGMTYGDFRKVLKAQVSESIIGTEVYVSLATVRQISVFVAGEVNTPGVIRTSSLATPLEILMNAGGVKKTGSLRNITIYRGGEKTTLDIYGLLKGQVGSFDTLNDGDRVIVPTIGATIALDGEMVRPGIYELPAKRESIPFTEAMDMAGGTLRPAGYEISQVSVDEHGRQTFRRIEGRGQNVKNGEALIARLIENSQSGKVELIGHVKTPGIRSLSTSHNIYSLLGNVLNLKDDPYLLFGVIERVDKATQARYLTPFTPQTALSGNTAVHLNDRDRVVFLGRSDISFLISDDIRQVIFSGRYDVNQTLDGGQPNPNYCEPLGHLARIINDTQTNRFATATRAVFVRKEAESEKDKTVEDEEKEKLRSKALVSKDEEALMMEELLKKEAEKKEKVEKGQPQCPIIYQEVKNLLPFILEYIVSIDGAVRLPGVYPITNGASIKSLVAVSGGMTNDANLTNIEVTSYDSEVKSGFIEMEWNSINAHKTDISKVKINPGGGVRIGSKFSNFESGAVLMSGEFIQPGAYTIQKGEKLSDLMLRAGGVSEQAYTYGAIFTRERVKEIQRQELQKTAKHLQSAMISASVKKNIEADSLMAAQQLTNQLANAELIGRVVIEADPLKLSLNPELDTVLEAGDTIYIPKRPNFIIAMGDVLNPGALQFIPGKTISEYIDEVGSYTASADESRVYIVYPNGVSKPITLSSWGGDRDLSIPPGTAIVVPTDLSPYDSLSLIKEIGGIFQNLAVSAASIAVLIRN
tara:strand:- start:13273 stop:16032 length:2760 start_codon:yes stop_codon:yes gene_type:complete